MTAEWKPSDRGRRLEFYLKIAGGALGCLAALAAITAGLRSCSSGGQGGTAGPTEMTVTSQIAGASTDFAPSGKGAGPSSTTPMAPSSSKPTGPTSTKSGSTTSKADATSTVVYLAQLPASAMEIENSPGGCTGGCTGFEAQSASINGRTYSESWTMRAASSGASWTKWVLKRACGNVTVTVGLDDDMSSDGRVTFSYQTQGGARVPIGTLGKGQSVTRTLPVSGAYELKLIAVRDGAGSDGQVYADFGDPHTTCRSDAFPDVG